MWLNLFHRCSHGLRTGIFEASKLVLINFAPNLPEIQVITTLLTAWLVSSRFKFCASSLYIIMGSLDVELRKKLVLNDFKTPLVLWKIQHYIVFLETSALHLSSIVHGI